MGGDYNNFVLVDRSDMKRFGEFCDAQNDRGVFFSHLDWDTARSCGRVLCDCHDDECDCDTFYDSYVRISQVRDAATTTQVIDAAIRGHDDSFTITKLQWSQQHIPEAATADQAVEEDTRDENADAKPFLKIHRQSNDQDGFLLHRLALLEDADTKLPGMQAAIMAGRDAQQNFPTTATADKAARAQTDTKLPRMQTAIAAGRDAQQNLPTTAAADKAAKSSNGYRTADANCRRGWARRSTKPSYNCHG